MLPSGPFAPAPPQPLSANPVVASNEKKPNRIQVDNIFPSSFRHLPAQNYTETGSGTRRGSVSAWYVSFFDPTGPLNTM